jgi:hypothetical protein
MKLFLIIIVMIVSIMPSVYANDQGVYNPGERINLVANCFNSSDVFVASKANISMRYPNTTIFLNNGVMSQTSTTGKLNYSFTAPNATGVYDVTVKCLQIGTNRIAQNGSSFQITKDTMTTLAIVFVMLGLIMYFFKVGSDLIKTPKVNLPGFNKMLKVINTSSIGVFMFLSTSWFLLALLAIATKMAEGTNYYGIMFGVFRALIPVIGLFNVAYLSLFVIFLIYDRIDSIRGQLK